MLKNQSQKGNNGLTKYMYITFSLQAQDLKEVIDASIKAVEIIIKNGAKAAMNELNGFKLSKNE